MGVFDLLTENAVTKVRLVVYAVLVLFSFFIFVGVAVMKDRTNICPLYYSYERYAPPVANCNYPMAVSIMFQLMYTLFRIVILVLLILGKLTTEMFVFSNILELVYVVIDVIAFILTFIAACILSAGHNNSSYIKNYETIRSPSNIAQAGAWISTFLWLFVAAIGAIYILRAGKLPFGRSQGAAASGTTTTASAPQMDTPPNYEPSKY